MAIAPSSHETVLKGGPGRWVEAVFLTVWLAFWAVGWVAAVAFCLAGAYGLLTGQFIGGRPPPEPGPGLVGGLFFLFWLSFWTLGGMAAGRELLGIIYTRVRLTATMDGLRVITRLGPFQRTRLFLRPEIRRIYLGESRSPLMLETARGSVELSALGSPLERTQAAVALGRALGLDPESPPTLPVPAPEGWEEERGPHGEILLIPLGKVRKGASLVLAGVALWAGVAAGFLFIEGRSERTYPGLGAIVGLGALGLGLTGAWLRWARLEWEARPGVLIARRRVGERVRPLGEFHSLALTTENDSDGDRWHVLQAQARPGAPGPAARTVAREVHDGTNLRRLRLWLAHRARLV